jgi:hypothetical protein
MSGKSIFLRTWFAALACSLFASAAFADWPTSATVNLPICTAVGTQTGVFVVSDGAGGAILVWNDVRNGVTSKVFAQHVLASGQVDAQYPTNGVAVATSTATQVAPKAVSDGQDGAIIAWSDLRGGTTSDIYATRLLPSGTTDPAWSAGGVAVCAAAGNQNSQLMSEDGAGGTYIAWVDFRSDTMVYAAHLTRAGQRVSGWPVDGASLAAFTNNHQTIAMCADARGGAFVSWPDFRGGNGDIKLQHLVAGGVDGNWPPGGVTVCAAAGDQLRPSVSPDGAGGVWVSWQDQRGGVDYDIYVAHVLSTGAIDGALPADGLAVCVQPGQQQLPRTVPDLAGGVIVGWQDLRSGTADLYAHHVTKSGSLDALWPASGRALCLAPNTQQNLVMVPDGAGGALAAWDDQRLFSNLDVYATHLLASGSVDPLWPTDGAALSTASGFQNAPAIINDGSGGIIAAWADSRLAGTPDIYAQRIQSNGSLGGSVVDVPADAPHAMSAAVRVWPVPVRSPAVRVGFAAAIAGEYALSLVDVQGRTIAALPARREALGACERELVLGSELKNGIYFARVSGPQGVASRRFCVLQR